MAKVQSVVILKNEFYVIETMEREAPHPGRMRKAKIGWKEGSDIPSWNDERHGK